MSRAEPSAYALRQPLIRLEGVGKSYPLLQHGGQQLAQVWTMLKGVEPGHAYKALQQISFEVWRGQSMGLIGVNGAGKSTLLKLIAGVVKPSQGKVERHGSVGALLELGAGFHPDYTGRENIYLACALMGMSREQTQERLDSILAFADIGAHIDQPIKHYSSGMVVRLGFAVATSVVPDVLITDEVLAVGDESFQKKCIAWMERYLAGGGTLLLCSHSMYHIQKLCQRALWMDQGQMRMLGDAHEVVRSYLAWHEAKSATATGASASATHNLAGLYHIKELTLNGQDQPEPLLLPMGCDLIVAGTVYSPDGRTPNVAVSLVRADGTPVYGVSTEMDGYALKARPEDGLFAFNLTFPKLSLLPGRYTVRAHAMDPEGVRLFDQAEKLLEVGGDARELGLCRLPHHWQ